ncbi:MAG TPA: efflux RND transporter permease subunit [Candidatus Cybelea sp.]|jgi:multidrug efflux pump subunit AcrB
MNPARFALRHARAVGVLAAVLTAAGVWAYLRTPASIFPEMHFSRIDVVVDAGDTPPEQMRAAATLPLERTFVGLPALSRVVATSARGASEFELQFDPRSDTATDLQYVNAAIAQARELLPAGATVQANIVNPQTEPILSYALTSNVLSQTLVREYAVRTLLPSLYGIPGLGRVLVVGGGQREYHVDLDPAALATAGVTAANVSDALAAANHVTAVGNLLGPSQLQTMLVDTGLTDATQLARVVVPAKDRSITVGSLGRVHLGIAPMTTQMAYNAQHGVAIQFYALPGADTVRLARTLSARFAALGPQMPGIVARRYWDASDLIVASQRSLRDAIVVGALLALGVILFFLRDARMTLVAALVIPAAMAIAILAISLFGETLNIMSVGGLAVAVGLIIDDAIVVVEGIARTREDAPELSTTEAIGVTMDRLKRPMLASTLATVVIFIPLSLLGGVPGAFFRALALTLSCALLVSLALAFFVTPLLVQRIVPEGESHVSGRAAFLEEHGLVLTWAHALRWALRNRGAVYAICAGVLIVTVGLLVLLPSDFLPRLDEGQFEIAYRMPVGTTLAASDAAALALERAVIADPAVEAEGRITGIDTNGFSPTPPRAGIMRVRLVDPNRRAPFETIADRLRTALNDVVPAAALDVHQILEDLINDVSGAPAPVQIVISGTDQATLAHLSDLVSDRVGSEGGLTDVASSIVQDDPTFRVVPDFAALARSGATPDAFLTNLAAATQGSVATDLATSTASIPVRVGIAGVPLPLTQIASTSVDRSATDITEINGERVAIISANTTGRNLSSTIAGVRKALANVQFPPGYRYRIEGAYQAQQDSFRQFAVVIAIAIGLVFFTMLATFGSFRQPFVILAAVPLAPIGVALALWITRTPFNVASFMGLLLLVGLVVKNGILLVDAANRRRGEGEPMAEALAGAGHERLRPILMTTLATIGGLLPLAFGIGAGAAMEQPLAIAVVGGLSTATFFTLVLIPVLYSSLSRDETAA